MPCLSFAYLTLQQALTQIPPAPVFYPTHAEWENPYEYINKVRSSAEPYGICKIVPPPKTRGCTPESFAAVVDDSEFKFSTKAQYVHLLSRRGPCQCFMMHLKSYLESTGRTLQTELPMVGNRPINLYLLYNFI